MDKHNHKNVYAAIAASTIVTVLANYLVIQNLEVKRVGGSENYKLYEQMLESPKFAENMKQNFEANIKMMNGEEPTAPDNNQPTAEPKASGTISSDEIAGILKDTYVKGNKDATIVWIEYSDLECPFCKRLHDSGAIKNLEAKHGNKLAVAFKHYPLPFHPTAMPAAQAAECVAEAGGSAKYFSFIEGVFAK